MTLRFMINQYHYPTAIGGNKMKQAIQNNSSETITVVTDRDRLAIKQEFKGSLSPDINRYKVMILNKDEVRRLLPIANCWLKGGK